MRNRFNLIIIVLLALSAVSCSPGGGSSGSEGKVIIQVLETNLNLSVEVAPPSEELELDYYIIKGTYETGKEKIEQRFKHYNLEIEDLAGGNWTFVIEGYNKNDKLIAKTKTETIAVESGINKNLNFQFNYIDNGDSTFEISISGNWPESDLISSINGEIRKDGSEDVLLTKTWDKVLSLDSISWTGELASGKYKISLTAIDKDGETYGTTKGTMIIVSGYKSSGIILTYDISRVKTPEIAPEGGFISKDCLISITSGTNGASIYYTTDGSEPNKNSTEYKEPFKADNISTIKAIAYKDGMYKSEIASADFIYSDPDNTKGYYLKIDTSEYDAVQKKNIKSWYYWDYDLKKPFEVSLYDSSDNPVDTAGMDTAFKWYIDGRFHKTGNAREYIEYKDLDTAYDVTVIASIDGIDLAVTMDKGDTKYNYIGPAGGYIFYDVDADNNGDDPGLDNLTSATCGWRFLEAAPADVKSINGIPSIDKTAEGYVTAEEKYIFGYKRTSGVTISSLTSMLIGAGWDNTENKLTSEGNGYSGSITGDMLDFWAAKLCKELSYEHKGITYDDWFLPSSNELEKLVQNLAGINGAFVKDYYWSSSESDANKAWCYHTENLSADKKLRGTELYVRPVRAFSPPSGI